VRTATYIPFYSRNIDQLRRIVNGSTGIVEKFHWDGNGEDENNLLAIEVRLDDDGSIYRVERVTATFPVGPNQIQTRTQFLLARSFAITIHKSQGMSCENVMISLSYAFVDALG
jgi:ATP-dependent exoDNAse (exonuclease V) alpha subunit